MKQKLKNSLVITAGIISLLITGCKKKEDEATALTIGQNYNGGVIFYLDNTGKHGFIAASSDQSTSASWGCYGSSIIGADGKATGTGAQNTIDIVKGCSTSGTAAKLCDQLVLNGYSDWFLPSKDELHLLYGQKSKVGGFSSSEYWSSSELSSSYAYYEDFLNGSQYNDYKDYSKKVRAIRSF